MFYACNLAQVHYVTCKVRLPYAYYVKCNITIPKYSSMKAASRSTSRRRQKFQHQYMHLHQLKPAATLAQHGAGFSVKLSAHPRDCGTRNHTHTTVYLEG
jgi:hypothetical protein